MTGYFRKRGNTWSFTVDIGRKPDGSREQKTKGGFKTKKEAEKACAELITLVGKDNYIEPSKKTISDLMLEWLDYQLKATLRLSTYENYSKAILKRLIPAFGHVKLGELKPIHIQKYYKRLQDEDLSPEYVTYLHAIMRSFMKYQIRIQNIQSNIFDLVDPPTIRKKEKAVWSIEEINRFLSIAKEEKNHNFYMIYLIAIYTGLRRGEVLALRWKDIDLANGKLSVCQNLYYSKGCEFHFWEPKTGRSNRLVSIPESLVKELHVHKELQQTHINKVREVYEDHGLVIANELGIPVHPRSLTDNFRRLIKKSNVTKIRFHDLRHTHATILLQLGEHVKIVSERLGHSDASMTMNVYSHVTRDMQEHAARRFEKAMQIDIQNRRIDK
ncbi:site-specific integrase [Brevibacillus laterosporus]|uniref:Site-specific integrase n=1 Tax=Brevibacillus laterosporus TaxID=1465 RepID=A0A518V622_BRELA|nr:site-specific integrase [Brevibacillus laterosporus]